MGTFEKFISGDLNTITYLGKSISPAMFAKMSAIERVNFTDLKVLEEYAFYRCNHLETVKISGVEKIGEKAFSGCWSLKTLIIESNFCVPSLKEDAFEQCIHFLYDSKSEALAKFGDDLGSAPVHVRGSIESINDKTGFIYVPEELVEGYKSSKDWSFLKERILPLSQIPKGSDAFLNQEDEKLRELLEDLNYLTGSECFEVDSPVEKIGDGAFFNTKLEKAEFENAIEVGASSFEQCFDLKSITLHRAERINKYAFNFCISLERAALPNAQVIEKDAFCDCQQLTISELPTVKNISRRAFMQCFQIRELDAPMLESVGVEAFCRCVRLKNLNLPKLRSVGEMSFAFCTSLETAVLPEIEEIGDKAFNDCYRLATLVLPNKEKMCKIAPETFVGACHIWGTSYGIHHHSAERDGRIYVADNLLDDYLNDPIWKEISHCIKPISEIENDQEGSEEGIDASKTENDLGSEELTFHISQLS